MKIFDDCDGCKEEGHLAGTLNHKYFPRKLFKSNRRTLIFLLPL